MPRLVSSSRDVDATISLRAARIYSSFIGCVSLRGSSRPYQLWTLVYRCLHGMAPEYLTSSFQRVSDVTTRRHLRSPATSQLILPAITRCSTLDDRAFTVAALRAWNAVPLSVSSAPSLLTFRRLLKTHLFHRSFCW